MIELLLDGDWVIYTAGFAGQKTRYLAPELQREEFANMTEVKEEAKAQTDGEPDTGPLYSRVIADPLDHVLHSAKMMLETQIEKTREKFDTDDVNVRVFVDGDGNFRCRRATLAPYKGNRANASKPVYFNDIRQYLLDNWDAEVVHGIESDDAMAIAATGNKNAIICAVDKDMLQVSAWHLNPNKGWKRVSEAEGRYRLYVQAAQGDAVDNIKGAYKVGPKAAQAAFATLKGADDPEYLERLIAVYEETVEKYGEDIYNGLSAREAALENLELVYLLRTETEAEEARRS
jgi:5'-3' exonuclease